MKHLEFVVAGPPIGKGRPKAVRQGGFVRMYTPKLTVEYETDVAFKASLVMGDMPVLETPVSMNIVAHYPIPASWSKKKQQQALAGLVIPGKPDLDNVGKAILDALNGVVYVDDKQVVRLVMEKRYSFEPRIEVTVKERIG